MPKSSLNDNDDVKVKNHRVQKMCHLKILEK